jgi:membrane-associated phospholipid phosphatase
MSLWNRRYASVRFRLVDIVCTSYLLLLGFLLIFFHKSVPNWPLYTAAHIFVVLGILELVRWGERNRGSKIRRFFRTFYPVAFSLFAWRELDALIPMFFGRYWATDAIIRLEKAVFGILPNVWFQKFYEPWLDELMHVFYAGYYLYMPLVSLVLFFKKKYEAALASFSIGIFAYSVNFFLFFFFPVMAPFMAGGMADYSMGSWTGYFVADVTRLVQSAGACRGATFPSSHITAVFVWSFIALRYIRPLGYILLPLAFGVAVSTVYLGYHFALDTFFGMGLAVVCFPFALKILQSRNEDPLSYKSKER